MAVDLPSGAPDAEPMTALGMHDGHHGWRRHPAVRTGVQLTVGERAADRLRSGMGSWAFVISALLFLAAWMTFNAMTPGFDPFPFILLNLVLSCLAAMQGAILLIAAKRSDQVSSELALADYGHNQDALARIEALQASVDELRALLAGGR